MEHNTYCRKFEKISPENIIGYFTIKSDKYNDKCFNEKVWDMDVLNKYNEDVKTILVNGMINYIEQEGAESFTTHFTIKGVDNIKVLRNTDDITHKILVPICNQCGSVKHHLKQCVESLRLCYKCQASNHPTYACPIKEKNYKCINCNGNHASNSNTCPIIGDHEDALRCAFDKICN